MLMLPFGFAPASAPLGSTESGVVRVFRRHPVSIALGVITLLVGATWFMSRREGRGGLRQEDIRVDPTVRWNPKVRRWQDTRGKFVKAPPGAEGATGTRGKPVRLFV